MSAVLGIAWREVRERRVVIAAAAALSLLAGLCQLAPAPAGVLDFGEALALVLFMAIPVGAALAVGSSIVGRDLAERRLTFYFSRPLSAGALWAGKFLGGAILVLGAFFVCSIPMTLVTGGFVEQAYAMWMLNLLGLMGFAHVVTVMYRSGSRLVALDLCLGGAFLALYIALFRRMLVAGAGYFFWDTLLPVAIAAATVAALTAAAAQLARGRADVRRGHVALSLALWAFAAATLAALASWSGWVLRVTPADVGGVGYPLSAAPEGSAVLFRGSSIQGRAGFSPIFLMDGRSGSFVRLHPERYAAPAFSGDGTLAAWVAPEVPWWWYAQPYARERLPEATTRGASLAVARLDGGTPVIEEQPLALPDGTWRALAVDAAARRVLLSSAASLSVVDTSGGRLFDWTIANVLAADFLEDGTVRAYQKEKAGRGQTALVVLDWNTKDDSRIERARAQGDANMVLLARRGALSVVAFGAREGVILDAGSGAARRFDTASGLAALVLAGGQVALSLGEEVRVVTPEGETVAKLPIEPGAHVYALREPRPGELAVGLWTSSLNSRRTLLIDPATGAVRREEQGLLPAGAGPAMAESQPEPGSLASRLFIDLGGGLVVLEADGRRREIVATRD